MRRVNGIVGRPAVVSGPGQITALKEQVAGAVITHDEDDVALNAFLFRGELAEIDTAEPILRNLKFDGRLPVALAEIVFADRRIWLGFAFEGFKGAHETPAVTVVITRPEDLQLEGRNWIGAHHDLERLTGPHTVGGAIAFDPGAATVGEDLVNLAGELARLCDHPVASAGLLIFLLNEIGLTGSLRR